MKAERLHDVAFDIVQEIKSLGIHEKFEEAYEALNMVTNPPLSEQDQGKPDESVNQSLSLDELEETFQERLGDLFTALERAPSNNFVPSQARILKELGVWRLTGKRLQSNLGRVVLGGAAQTRDTYLQFEELWVKFSDSYEALQNLTESMAKLQIERQLLEEDQTEFGAYYPLQLRETSLGDIASELKELHSHLRTISEVANSNIGAIHVRAVSSSGLEAFLESPLAVATGLSVILRNLSAAWKNVEAARESRQKVATMGLGTELSEEEEQAYITGVVDELHERLMGWFAQEDEGRRNEVQQWLQRALDYFADRIEKGVIFEVKVFSSAGAEDEQDVELPEGISRSDLKDMGASMMDLEAAREEGFFMEPPSLLEADAEGSESEEVPTAEEEEDDIEPEEHHPDNGMNGD